MKIRMILMLALPITVLVVTSGCDRALVVKTPLGPAETVAKEDAVFVDGNPAGHVRKVVAEGETRFAVLAITDDSAKQKMRAGVVRVIETGKINLQTDSVSAESPLLGANSTIPVMSKTGFAVQRLTSRRMLTGLLIGLAIISVILLLFRRLARGWLLLLTLALSAASAWMVLPWAAGFVARGYALLPQPPLTSGNTSPSTGIQHGFSRLLETAPNPQIVAYAVIFVLAFIVLSVLLRGALNRLENRSQS
jgi:hypothetical protein